MKRQTVTWSLVLLAIVALVLFFFPLPDALAQRQGGGSGGGGGGGAGGGRPGGEESTTNLSYPANFFGTASQSGTIGTYSLGAVFGSGMSYGCAVPETIGTTTYPNTSCVNDDGTPQDAATCTAAGGKCKDQTLERIYWQKSSGNKWQGGYN